MNQNIIVIDWPPGSGKSTLVRSLVSEFSKYWLIPVQSVTTRAKRFSWESEHTFVSPEEFYWLLQSGKILTVWKRTPEYPDLCWIITPARENTIAILGRSGAEDAYQYCKSNGINFTYIWLYAQANILEKRLLERWDSVESVSKRLLWLDLWKDIQIPLGDNSLILDTCNKTKEEIFFLVKTHVSNILQSK
jgi:guanylate kinase